MYWIHFQNMSSFTYQKTLLHTLFRLFLKSSKAFSVSLMHGILNATITGGLILQIRKYINKFKTGARVYPRGYPSLNLNIWIVSFCKFCQCSSKCRVAFSQQLFKVWIEATVLYSGGSFWSLLMQAFSFSTVNHSNSWTMQKAKKYERIQYMSLLSKTHWRCKSRQRINLFACFF